MLLELEMTSISIV